MGKRIAAVPLIFLLLGILLSGCDGDNNSAIVGEWVPSTVSIGGTTIAYSELNTEGQSFQLRFFDNGKCEITLGGVKNDGTYTFNDTAVDIKYGGKTQKLSYDQGILTLKMDYNGQPTSYMFTKTAR